MMASIRRHLQAALAAHQALLADAPLLETLARAAQAAVAAYRGGRKLLLAGNGGSAADAQHIAGELVNRFLFERPALAAVALSTDTSILTAVGNDRGFEHVFARQLEALGAPGDLFLGLTTSGRSPNIRRALDVCRARGLASVVFTGQDGAGLADQCDFCLAVPARDTPRVQELHGLLAHVFCALVEDALFARGRPG